MKIIKHPLTFNAMQGIQVFRLSVPRTAEILSVTCFDDEPFMWVLNTEEHQQEGVWVVCVPSGVEIDEPPGSLVGVFQCKGETWHAFALRLRGLAHAANVST